MEPIPSLSKLWNVKAAMHSVCACGGVRGKLHEGTLSDYHYTHNITVTLTSALFLRAHNSRVKQFCTELNFIQKQLQTMFWIPSISIELFKTVKRSMWHGIISYFCQRREKLLHRLSGWPVTKHKFTFLTWSISINILGRINGQHLPLSPRMHNIWTTSR